MQEDTIDWAAVVTHLQAVGVPFEPGLTDAELDAAAAFVGAPLPAVYQSLLREGMPAAERSPDWRLGAPDALRAHLDAPVAGMLEAVRAGRFWSAEWGERPQADADAVSAAREALASVPRLVPVHGRRFLPVAPDNAPVFDVRGPVALFFGADLRDYVFVEFGEPEGHEPADINDAPDVPFWSELADFWSDEDA